MVVGEPGLWKPRTRGNIQGLRRADGTQDASGIRETSIPLRLEQKNRGRGKADLPGSQIPPLCNLRHNPEELCAWAVDQQKACGARKEPRLATGYALAQAGRFKLRASTVFQILHREPLNGRSSALSMILAGMRAVVYRDPTPAPWLPSDVCSRTGIHGGPGSSASSLLFFFLSFSSLPSSRRLDLRLSTTRWLFC
ncbi:hypothetical protein BC567DRAFT_209341 [Phyllosticta citribraziliensis]